MSIPSVVFEAYALDPDLLTIRPIGAGHIHKTFKLEGSPSFILQRVNKNVFKKPEIIAANLRAAADYLHKHHPGYLFLSTIKTNNDREMVYDEEGFPWRLFPYIENTITMDEVETPEEAYSAASEFAKLTRNLDGVDVGRFKETIDRFQDLTWRWEQFEESLGTATEERINEATPTIQVCQHYAWLVKKYKALTDEGTLVLRVTHNDTKINNILFDAQTRKALCAIDLDTLMPGYFIYDLGDMIRTFVSPVNEEEKDLTRIIFREDIYKALVEGYMSQMEAVLKKEELNYVHFGGMMMTYIMAMRMLTDFLNGDVYYHTTYPGQNLVRASNQFRLLSTMEHYFNTSSSSPFK